jgi:hypothetical protein
VELLYELYINILVGEIEMNADFNYTLKTMKVIVDGILVCTKVTRGFKSKILKKTDQIIHDCSRRHLDIRPHLLDRRKLYTFNKRT